MLKNLPIIILGIALIVIVVVSCYTDPRNQDKQNGTDHNPSIASIVQNDTSPSSQKTQASSHAPVWRMILAWPEGVTTLAVLLTLFFIAWQTTLTRQAIVSAESSSKKQLRAYLSVVIGSAVYQIRRTAEEGGDLKFDASPLLVNNGQTPAREIRFTARAAILPVPLQKEKHLPEEGDEGLRGNVLGPQQNGTMTAVVDGYCSDSEVQDIKEGCHGKSLYVWGLVTYEDIFGDHHQTRFCQRLWWDMKDNVRGQYVPGRNDAT